MEGVKHGGPSLDEARASCPEEISPDVLTRAVARAGFEYGAPFQGIERLWRGRGQAMALVRLPDALRRDAPLYAIHPCLLDACLRIAAMPVLADGEPATVIPVGLGRLRAHRAAGETLYCHARIRGTEDDGRTISADIDLFDEAGALVIEAHGFRLRRTTVELGASVAVPTELLELTWKQAPPGPPSSSPRRPGPWIVVGDPRGRGAELVEYAALQGQQAILAPHDPAALNAELARAAHVVYLGAAERGPATVESSAGIATEEAARVLGLTAAILATPSPPRLWIATVGAHRVRVGDRVDASQAALWGLGRVLAAERRDAWGALVDLESRDGQVAVAHLFDAIAHADGEDQLAYRDGLRFAARLVPAASTDAATPVRLSSEGAYLVTGGTGGVGLEVLRWMVERGASRIVAMSRSGVVSSPGALEDLRARGCDVVVAQGDVSVLADVERVVSEIDGLRGIVHCAGTLDDGAIGRQTAERLANVMAPKAAGAVNLHVATREKALDAFVLFSSMSGVLGMPGQSTYAAANAFLDAFAHARTAAGFPTVSIAWGRWDGVGMSSETAAGPRLRDRWDAWGLLAIRLEDAFHALDVALTRGAPQLVVFPFERAKFFANFPGAHRGPLLRALAPARPTASGPPSARASFLQLVAATPPAARLDLFASVVQTHVTRLLGNPWPPPGVHESLTAAGVDSLMAVELANVLGELLSRKLSATLVFNHPTIHAIARHFAETWDRRKSDRSPPTSVEVDAEQLLAEIESMSEEDAQGELDASPPSARGVHAVTPPTKRGS